MSKIDTLLEKIKTDRAWYMEKFLKIRDKKAKLVPFKINYAQKVFLEHIEEDDKNLKPKRYIILKARQLGMSTFTEGYIYHATSTQENVNSLIIAHEEKATLNLFQMSKLYYEESPLAIRPMKKYSNGKTLWFENPTVDEKEKLANPGLRSKITLATAGTNDTGRSNTYHNIHVSEIAFFPNPENTMTALMQCVPDEPNTFVCLESTANGVGGWFYDFWYAACRGENDFTPLFFPWHNDPNYRRPFKTEEEKKKFIKEVNQITMDEYGKERHTDEWYLIEEFGVDYEQLNWRKWKIRNDCGGSLDMFHQEYPSTPEEAFIASGRPVFDMKALKEYELACCAPEFVGDMPTIAKEHVVPVPSEKGLLKIWMFPEEDMNYTIGCDVAEGLETGDYSVGTVMDDNLNVVAKWRGHLDPDLFGKAMVNLARYYNDAYLVVEINNHGLTTMKSITDEEYWNVFYTKTYDRLNNLLTKKLGWHTNKKTKPLAIDKLAEYIRENYLALWDKDIVTECYTYVIDERGATNAQEGMHDDCVMSLALTLQGILEKVGEDFIPEIPHDGIEMKKKKQNFDVPEIIDPLFEDEDEDVEYSI